jgi:hypothetical protein
MNELPKGVQMLSTAEHAVEDKNIARFTIRIWPLPIEIIPDFQKFMEAAAHEYLMKIELVSGERIDLTRKGALQ